MEGLQNGKSIPSFWSGASCAFGAAILELPAIKKKSCPAERNFRVSSIWSSNPAGYFGTSALHGFSGLLLWKESSVMSVSQITYSALAS
jgi:hypothetical protein